MSAKFYVTVDGCLLLVAALALASFECEAPENQFEKERYKSLKYVITIQ